MVLWFCVCFLLFLWFSVLERVFRSTLFWASVQLSTKSRMVMHEFGQWGEDGDVTPILSFLE